VAGNETKGQLPQEKFAEQLDELDEGLVNLHVLYEKYFLGIDRKPPDQERKKVSGRIRELRNMMIKNTGLKFRLNTMFAKLISHERLGTGRCARSKRAPTSATSSRPSSASTRARAERSQSSPNASSSPTTSSGGSTTPGWLRASARASRSQV
jgi:hypothetical protein